MTINMLVYKRMLNVFSQSARLNISDVKTRGSKVFAFSMLIKQHKYVCLRIKAEKKTHFL